MVEPRWHHALLQQQCVDTVPSYASKFTSRTPNGTTSPTCRAPSYPATHSHGLLKILDAVAEQSICCLLALTVSLLGFHNLLRILGMMSSVWSMGNATGQLHSDNGGWFLPAQMNWEPCVSVSYLQAGVGPWMAEVVKSPWLRRGVYRFPLEFRGHTIAPGKLEYSHGNRTLSSTTRYMQWKRLNKSTANKCRLLFKFLSYNWDRQ